MLDPRVARRVRLLALDVDGVLTEWDTRGLNGLYAVQLVVVRTDQRVETAVTQVTVSNP